MRAILRHAWENPNRRSVLLSIMAEVLGVDTTQGFTREEVYGPRPLNKVQWIKEWRAKSGDGLKESKDEFERRWSGTRYTTVPSPIPAWGEVCLACSATWGKHRGVNCPTGGQWTH